MWHTYVVPVKTYRLNYTYTLKLETHAPHTLVADVLFNIPSKTFRRVFKKLSHADVFYSPEFSKYIAVFNSVGFCELV